MAKKIYISPSNQNGNRYAYGNTTEDVQCGKIGKALEAALQRCGFETMYGQYDTMQNRVARSNKWGANMHIPVHTNAFNGEVGGTRIFYYAENGYGNKAAKCVYDELKGLTPGKSDNMSAQPDLYELRAPDATSVYVEAEFHDVPEYAKWIIEHTVEIGEAICRGVCAYYGVKYVEPGSKPQPEPNPTGQTYIVKKGDTLSEIAAAYGVSLEKLLAANPQIKNPNLIHPGDIINVPAGGQKPAQELAEGDKVKMAKGAPVYGTAVKFDAWVYDSTLYVREVNGSRVVVSTKKTGAVTGAVDKKYLTKI